MKKIIFLFLILFSYSVNASSIAVYPPELNINSEYNELTIINPNNYDINFRIKSTSEYLETNKQQGKLSPGEIINLVVSINNKTLYSTDYLLIETFLEDENNLQLNPSIALKVNSNLTSSINHNTPNTQTNISENKSNIQNSTKPNLIYPNKITGMHSKDTKSKNPFDWKYLIILVLAIIIALLYTRKYISKLKMHLTHLPRPCVRFIKKFYFTHSEPQVKSYFLKASMKKNRKGKGGK